MSHPCKILLDLSNHYTAIQQQNQGFCRKKSIFLRFAFFRFFLRVESV